MKNAVLNVISSLYVRDDEVFSFVDTIMSDINYQEDYDLIQQNNKREFLVDIGASKKIDEIIENEEVSVTEEKKLRDFQKLIFRVEDEGYSDFIVNPT